MSPGALNEADVPYLTGWAEPTEVPTILVAMVLEPMNVRPLVGRDIS